LLDYVVDTARGEVIVGNGYPYAIEAADQTAVLDARDREMFYAIFQEFAEREQLNLSLARKAISKAHRR
jgi:alpha-acetolactate decarboxylase